MKKIIARFLIFLLGIPLIAALVFLFPQYDHLVLNIFVVVFSVLGALELQAMLKKKQLLISRIEAAILGGLVPALVTLRMSCNLPLWIVPVFFAGAMIWLLVSSIFMTGAQEHFINRAAAGFAALLYPGSLLAWICAMGKWDGKLILIFLLVPIMSDSTAWAAGMLFGRNNRGIINVSPNKSIAGFIGGLFASVVICMAAAYIFPQFFTPRFGLAALLSGAGLGLISGIAAALGDLCESAIKRSAEYKDSGSLMPGRGGVLDSVDSVALAAPVFYIAWTLLFNFA